MKGKTRSDKGTTVSFEECSVGWTRQDKGWYTHPELGGICKEKTGWWWHPGAGSGLSMVRYFGPYKTLLMAQKDSAEWEKIRDLVKAK